MRGKRAAMDAESLRLVLVRVAGEAAGLLRDLSCREEYTVKVTGETMRIDMEAEEYVIDALRSEGLGGAVITEERGLARLGGPGPVFILDPLDGSMNYANCIPWANVSIAAAPPGASGVREVVAGAIAPVFQGPVISFARGRGCYLGGVRVTEPRRPPAPFVYVYMENPSVAPVLARVHEALGRPKVRSLGSAALEMAYTALGRGVLFLDLRGKLRNVDIAAALGLTLECGGEVYTAGGRLLDAGLDGVERVGDVISSSDPSLARWASEVAGGHGEGPEARSPS